MNLERKGGHRLGLCGDTNNTEDEWNWECRCCSMDCKHARLQVVSSRTTINNEFLTFI